MHAIDESQIDTLLKGVQIPPCPAVLTQLSREMEQEDLNLQRIGRLISQDVALAAGVLKIANSPLFGGRQVGSVGEALNLLGLKNVFNLVVSQLVRTSQAAGPRAPTMARFWDSAAYSASVCALLAAQLPGSSRENAYSFGLFHDCGIPLLMQKYPDYKDVLKQANTAEGLRYTQVEDGAYGTNHAVVGYLFARQWGLADVICQAILSHHDFVSLDHEAGLSDEACTLIAINLLAERIVNLFLRVNDEAEWDKGKQAVCAFFGLSEQDLDDIVDDTLVRLEKTRAVKVA
ncbi:HDOD domain-containing protein [Oryzomicrobium sp.]|uniref:HDOD domain-containing protein n=1 Tax=Oryzomicrobium sp. TaxID=1911578 RepID=UPI0025D2237E|nr:HDOD domain-containing protein [Oryzomicrobium sp.]MCE1242889.1 HDOD domain-containing protein [Oryzomicrobium sp.]